MDPKQSKQPKQPNYPVAIKQEVIKLNQSIEAGNSNAYFKLTRLAGLWSDCELWDREAVLAWIADSEIVKD